jgi:nucleoside-diphosphate-sugar epimerase
MKFFDRPNVSKYIQLGTSYEFGPQNGALDECSATTPNTLYGKSKLAGKLSLFNSEIRESTLFYLRLFGIFGSYETPTKLFPQLYRTIVESEPIEFSDGLQRVDYMHCQNLVKAIIKIHEFKPTQDRYLFVLGSGVPKSLRQISRCFRRLYPDSPPIEWGQSNRRKSGADVQYANTRHARDLLGWCPDASLEDGIRQFCKEMALVKDSVSI